jgi:bifunctional ADP-heptose synthase (sugar kinase/adenylyltransferase)
LDVFVYGEVKRLCPDAPAPVFTILRSVENPGMAGNVSNNLNAMSTNHDLFTNNNFKSVKKIRYVDERTNTLFLRVDKNDDVISRCDIKNIKWSDYDVVLITDYCKGFLEEEDIEHITNCHDKVFLDTKKLIGSWAKNAFIIKINSMEFERTKHTIDSVLMKKLICTMGLKGCQYQGKTYSVKEVEIKDVSGAGDTFLSALVSSYVKNKNIDVAIEYANECATLVVQKRGVTTI